MHDDQTATEHFGYVVLQIILFWNSFGGFALSHHMVHSREHCGTVFQF